MTTSSIINMAKNYMKIGMAAGIILVMAYVVGYFWLYQKVFQGKKRLRFRTVVSGAVFVCYLIVVCGATLRRGGNWRGIQLLPFSSYLDAWCNFSIFAWRNLILNILLFVPFGLLLPCLLKEFRKPWKTYVAGVAFSALIEIMQLLFHWGIFEADDILNNFLGVVIGYGCYRLLHFLLSMHRSERDKLTSVLIFQIPLCITAIVFGVIFLAYQCKEFGNLQSAPYYRRVSMKGVEVQTNIELSEEQRGVQIYQLHRASREETLEAAKTFYDRIDVQIDMSRIDYYENTVIYFSEGNHQSLWIDYAGCTMQFYDFSAGWENDERVPEKEDASREEVETALLRLGVSLPKDMGFENLGEGRYRFAIEQYENEDSMYDGQLTCKYHINGKVSGMDNHICTYQKYREAQIKTEQEAYQDILAGKFLNGMQDEKLTELTVNNVEIAYEIDSKGFYQPVYMFEVLYNQKEGKLVIPALKN